MCFLVHFLKNKKTIKFKISSVNWSETFSRRNETFQWGIGLPTNLSTSVRKLAYIAWMCALRHHATPSPTWKVDSGEQWCTRGHRGMHQVRVLEPKPSSQRAWIRAAECHPLPVCQPSGLSHHSTEVSEVSQSLPTAEETQIVCAEVPEWRKRVKITTGQ